MVLLWVVGMHMLKEGLCCKGSMPRAPPGPSKESSTLCMYHGT